MQFESTLSFVPTLLVSECVPSWISYITLVLLVTHHCPYWDDDERLGTRVKVAAFICPSILRSRSPLRSRCSITVKSTRRTDAACCRQQQHTASMGNRQILPK